MEVPCLRSPRPAPPRPFPPHYTQFKDKFPSISTAFSTELINSISQPWTALVLEDGVMNIVIYNGRGTTHLSCRGPLFLPLHTPALFPYSFYALHILIGKVWRRDSEVGTEKE
jgi:hypothetical protein